MASSETMNKCRLCLKIGVFRSIFSSFQGTILYSKIAMGCSNVQIFEGDGFPNTICEECIEKLNFIYTFKMQCENCDAQLRMTLPKIHEIELPSLNCNSLKFEMVAPKIEPCDNLPEEKYSIKASDNMFTNELDKCSISQNKRLRLTDDVNHLEAEMIAPKVEHCNNLSEVKYSINTMFTNAVDVYPISRNKRSRLTDDVNYLEVEMLVPKVEPCDNLLKERNSVNASDTMFLNEVDVYPISQNKKSYLTGDFSYDNTPSKLTHPFKCSICDIFFDTVFGFDAHQKVHMSSKKFNNKVLSKYNFICKLCKEGFKSQGMFRLHIHKCKLKSNASTLYMDVIEKCLRNNLCPVCKDEFPKKRIPLERHLKSPCGYFLKSRICELKGKLTSNIRDVERVIEEITQAEKIVQCSNCNAKFETHASLLCHFDHCIKSKDIIKISCMECKLVFPSKHKYVKHVDSKHISIFDFSVTNLNTNEHNLLSTSVEIMEKCDKISIPQDVPNNQMLDTRINNTSRKDRKSKKKARKCKYCLNSFFSKELLSIHLAHYCRHNNIFIKKPTCHVCSKTFSLLVQLNCHLKTQHDMDTPNTPFVMKPPICDFCFSSFDDRKQMLKHREEHFSKEMHLCKLCNKYISRHMLRKHEVNHLNAHGLSTESYTFNRLTCEQCEEKFTSILKLMAHSITVHHKKFDFYLFCNIEDWIEKCSICNKDFSSCFLPSHIKFHDKYKCKKCSKYLFSERLFYRHNCKELDEPEKIIQVPIESNSAPIELNRDCEFCFKSVTISDMKSHNQRHLCRTKLGCRLCHKKFFSKSSLDRHATLHEQEDYTMNPLLCRHCGDAFIRYSLYKDHILKVHNALEDLEIHFEFPPQPCLICHKTFPFIHMHYKCHKDMQCFVCRKYILSSKLFKMHVCSDTTEDPALAVRYEVDITNLLQPDYGDYSEMMILRKYPIDEFGEYDVDPLSKYPIEDFGEYNVDQNSSADMSNDNLLPKISSVVSFGSSIAIKQEADDSFNMDTIEIKDEPINDGYEF